MEVKEALLDFAGGYGETDLTINHLSLLSWVTAGSKKVLSMSTSRRRGR